MRLHTEVFTRRIGETFTHKVFTHRTFYAQVCAKQFPVLLCTTRLAQNTPQYYFVLQSLHKALPSDNLYYTACTKYFPVLLSTTKRAQSTSQYYFVLQSLHKTLPSTTLENQPLVVLRDHAMTHGSWWATLLSGRCRQNA